MPGAPLIVLVAFVVGGLLIFPVMLLIAATAATFGPWFGFAYASIGALASATITYAIGFAVGRRTVEALMGPRLNRVRRGLVQRGVLAVAAVRLVPDRALYGRQSGCRREQNSVRRLHIRHASSAWRPVSF